MKSNQLRKKLIRLAHAQPQLREDLLPLIKASSTSSDLKKVVKKLRGVLTGQVELLQSLGRKVIALEGLHPNLDLGAVSSEIQAATKGSWVFKRTLGDMIKLLEKAETQLGRVGAYQFEKEVRVERDWVGILMNLSNILWIGIPLVITLFSQSAKLVRYISNKPLSVDAQQDLLDLMKASESIGKIPLAVNKAVSKVLTTLRGQDNLPPSLLALEPLFKRISKLSAPGSPMQRSMDNILVLLGKEAKRMGPPR